MSQHRRMPGQLARMCCVPGSHASQYAHTNDCFSRVSNPSVKTFRGHGSQPKCEYCLWTRFRAQAQRLVVDLVPGPSAKTCFVLSLCRVAGPSLKTIVGHGFGHVGNDCWKTWFLAQVRRLVVDMVPGPSVKACCRHSPGPKCKCFWLTRLHPLSIHSFAGLPC
jgi:hypothetical protein